MIDEAAITQALRGVVDPGLAESIVDLGWVTRVRMRSAGRVVVEMTPPTPAYPYAEVVNCVRRAIVALSEVREVDVRLVWDLPWTPFRMADHLKLSLGLSARDPDGSAPPAGSQRGRLDRLLGR